MKNIFKRFILVFLATLALCLPAVPVLAATDVLDDPCQGFSANDPNSPTLCQNTSQTPANNSIYGPNGILTKVISLLSIVIGIAAVLMIIIGGLRYIMSSGDPASINSAKNTILYAIIGLVIAVAAQSIIIFVINRI